MISNLFETFLVQRFSLFSLNLILKQHLCLIPSNIFVVYFQFLLLKIHVGFQSCFSRSRNFRITKDQMKSFLSTFSIKDEAVEMSIQPNSRHHSSLRENGSESTAD